MAGTTYQYILDLKDKMSGTLRKVGLAGGKTYDELQKKQEKLNSSMSGLGSMIGKIGVGISVVGIGKSIFDATMRMEGLENAISYMSGSTSEAEKNLSFLSATADRLGVAFEASLDGYRILQGGLKGKMDQSQIRAIYEGVATGAAAMHLTAEQSTGAFLALGQMASKGTVQAEELRGQLGERIPGAFGIAARAMGVTEQALGKMMQKGEVVANDFLPKFAEQMKKEFASAIPVASQSLPAAINRLQNKLFELRSNFGEDLNGSIKGVVTSLYNFASWMNKNRALLISVGKAALYVAGAIAIYKGVMFSLLAVQKLALFWQGVQLISINVLGDSFLTATVAQKLFAAAQWKVNAALAANPIGLIVAAVLALGFAVYKAIESYEKWGAVLLLIMGPIGLITNAIMALKNNWDSIVSAFRDGGIIAGLKRIGIVLLDTFLYPVQQLLGMLAKIPGLGKLAGKGEKSLIEMRKTLNLVTPKTEAPKTEKAAKASEKAGKATTFNTQLGQAPAKAEKEAKGISEGGSRPTNITITLGNLVETLNINTTTMKEGATELEQKVREALLRVLNSANGVAYGN